MSRPLPPLNSLRAFEAAARHLSFTKAAEELHVTPAAVSQQIKLLEEHCGTKLFRRLTRALMLTDAGQAALPPLREGFDKMMEAVGSMRAHDRSGILTVSVPPSFGAKWLVQRLDRLNAAHPEYDVRIEATDALADFSDTGVDIALRYGRGSYPGLRSELLMSEVAFPVCSPALLDGEHPLREPSDLRHHTLLHVQWKMEHEAAPNWRMWLRAAGVDDVDVTRGPRFTIEGMTVQAAIEGQGVALASGSLVSDDMKAGRLVRPFGPTICEATAFSYFLVYPEATADSPKVNAFRDWILTEIEADTDTEPAEGEAG